MLKVFGSYVYPTRRERFEKSFESYSALEEWLFSMMEGNYSGTNPMRMYFNYSWRTENGKEVLWCADFDNPMRISVAPNHPNLPDNLKSMPDVWIHMIKDDMGIAFSDGFCTNGISGWNTECHQWQKHCTERARHTDYSSFDWS